MAFIQDIAIPFTTDAGGAATVYSPIPVNGFIEEVRYVTAADATSPSDNVTAALTGEISAEPIYSETIADGDIALLVRSPRKATHSIAAAAAVYAAAGSPVLDRIAIAGERLKLVIGSGGNTKSGTLHVIVS